MTTYISLLRGINVSGKNKILMADLRGMYESLGFVNVQTYVQSGNVIFDYTGDETTLLATLIKNEIKNVFGYDVPVFIREPNDFYHIINNPFTNDSDKEPSKFYVIFLSKSPHPSAVQKLRMPTNESAEYLINTKEIFLYCPNGYGRTKLNNNFFEKKLNVPATTRNWKTVNKLYHLAMEET